MTSEDKKVQLVAAHRAVFDGLLDATDGLDAAGWSTPTGCPGWDVHDQLAHTVGAERRMLGDPPPDVEVPDLPHVRDDFGRDIERDVHARRSMPTDELVAEARETFQRRLAGLRELDPSVLDEPLDGLAGMRLKGSQMLRTRVFDLTSHEQDIRRALQRLEGFDGPHLTIAVEQVLRAWARYLPGRVDDRRVLAVSVEGFPAVAIDLGAGGLERDPEAVAIAAATLHLDAASLLALGGGRTDAPPLDALDVDGDRALVAEIRETATITP